MTTIPITHFPAQLQDGTNVHVVGVDPDSNPPRFVIMRPSDSGSIRPDLANEVFGVSLDDEPEAVDG